jgi:hypothetical protein
VRIIRELHRKAWRLWGYRLQQRLTTCLPYRSRGFPAFPGALSACPPHSLLGPLLPQLLVVSPLSRALNTALLAFGERPACPVVVEPLFRWAGTPAAGCCRPHRARILPSTLPVYSA